MFGLLVLCVCSLCIFFFLMIRRPPRSTRTDTLFPYTTLFRSNVTIDSLSRRSAIATFGIGAAAMTMNEASAQTPTAVRTAVPAFAGNHQVKPLRFDPARLDGLSERLITSHHENNYAGSVKALNMIETRIAAAHADPALPPVVYGGLKREELHRTGPVVLRSDERRVGKECVITCKSRMVR